MAWRAGFRTSRKSFVPGNVPFGAVLPGAFASLSILVSFGAAASDDGRPERFNDALGGNEEWDITVPGSPPAGDFRSVVLSGAALESTRYLEILGEFRRVIAGFERNPSGAEERTRLARLQQQLRQRVQLNMDAGYFYAAGVYIELLEASGASADEIRRLTEALQVRRRAAPG